VILVFLFESPQSPPSPTFNHETLGSLLGLVNPTPLRRGKPPPTPQRKTFRVEVLSLTPPLPAQMNSAFPLGWGVFFGLAPFSSRGEILLTLFFLNIFVDQFQIPPQACLSGLSCFGNLFSTAIFRFVRQLFSVLFSGARPRWPGSRIISGTLTFALEPLFPGPPSSAWIVSASCLRPDCNESPFSETFIFLFGPPKIRLPATALP